MSKHGSRWRLRCRPVIEAALSALPADATRRDAQRLLHPLYPFGPRRYHPYRMWCKEVRWQLDGRFGGRARHDPKAGPPSARPKEPEPGGLFPAEDAA